MGFLTIFRYYIEKFLLKKNFLNRIKKNCLFCLFFYKFCLINFFKFPFERFFVKYIQKHFLKV